MKMKQTVAAAALAIGAMGAAQAAADSREGYYGPMDPFITPGTPTQPPCPGCTATPGMPTDPDDIRAKCEVAVSNIAWGIVPSFGPLGPVADYGVRFLMGVVGYNVSAAVCDYLME